MVLPHVISQREDSAPWTTTICQTMHRVAIAPITDHTPTKNARNVRCDVTGRPARCWMWCAGSHDLTSPLRTRASHRFHHNLNLSPQRTSPPGSAGVAPACRVHRHCARIQRYTPSPLHRLGAQASSPPTTPHLGARASSPHTVIHHLGARASRPHAGCTGFQPAYDAPPRSTGVQPAYHGSGNGFLIMLSHPDKCLDCGFHKRADSILQQWLKRCQRFADRFAFTLSQITFPLLRP
jgi:hypothetical protein